MMCVLKKWIFILATLFSTNSFGEGLYHCESTLNVEKLYELKEDLQNKNSEFSYLIGDREFIADARYGNYFKVYLECLDKQISNLNIKAYSEKELHRLFYITSYINFYINESKLVSLMESIADLKSERGKYSDNYSAEVYRSYIKLRDFEAAKEFEKKIPHIKPKQSFEIANEIKPDRRLLDIDAKTSKLNAMPFSFKDEGYVVIVSSPTCNPSLRFLNWLNDSKNSGIKSALSNSSIFLTPSDSSLYVDEFARFNEKSSPLQLFYSYDQNDWPEIKLWDTPTFYFYYNGQLKEQIIGWPLSGREDALIKALKDIRLL